MPYEELCRRFRLEPRGEYMGSGSWLVVYDNDAHAYVPGSRAYMKFKNSTEAFNLVQDCYRN